MSQSRNIGKPNRSFAQKIPRHVTYNNELHKHYEQPFYKRQSELPYFNQPTEFSNEAGYHSPTLHRIREKVQIDKANREFDKLLNWRAVEEHMAREKYELRLKQEDLARAARNFEAAAKKEQSNQLVDLLSRTSDKAYIDGNDHVVVPIVAVDKIIEQLSVEQKGHQMATERVPEPIIDDDEFEIDYAVDGDDDEIFADDVDEEEQNDFELDDMPEEDLWAAFDDLRLKKQLRDARQREVQKRERQPAFAMSLQQCKQHFASLEAYDSDSDATLLRKAQELQQLIATRHEQKRQEYEAWVNEQFRDGPDSQPAYAA